MENVHKTHGVLADLAKQGGMVRTDLDCHSCREKGLPDLFIATINHDLDGNHEITCPRCGHIHYRVIRQGRATDERYSSGYPTHKVERKNVCKTERDVIVSSTTSGFLRDLWLQRE